MDAITKKAKYRSYLKKLDDKIKIEEAKENYEYCAYMLHFKNILLEYIKKDPVTAAEVRRFNLYLNVIEYKN